MKAGRNCRRMKIVVPVLLWRSERLEGAFLDEDGIIPSARDKRQKAFVHYENEQNIKFSLSYVLVQTLRPEAVDDEKFFKLVASKLVASKT